MSRKPGPIKAHIKLQTKHHHYCTKCIPLIENMMKRKERRQIIHTYKREIAAKKSFDSRKIQNYKKKISH